MKKTMYIGPTIYGVAARNTVFTKMPEQLKDAINSAPYLAGLCIPLSPAKDLQRELENIRRKTGASYTLYTKALTYSASKGE